MSDLIGRIDKIRSDLLYAEDTRDDRHYDMSAKEMVDEMESHWPAIRRVLLAAKAVSYSVSPTDYGHSCASPVRLDELVDALAALDGIK